MFGIFTNWGPTPAGDFPDVGNVVVGDTTDGAAGTYAPALVADVEDGVTYGEDGTEFEGTLEVTGEQGIFFLKRRP